MASSLDEHRQPGTSLSWALTPPCASRGLGGLCMPRPGLGTPLLLPRTEHPSVRGGHHLRWPRGSVLPWKGPAS